MNQADVVLAFWSEQRQQMRQSEDQRAVLTNYILVIVSALTGFAVQQKLATVTLPLTVLITLAGGYGAVTVAKYHERAVYHLGQARALAGVLETLGALPRDETLLEDRRAAHARQYRLLYRIRLHTLWTSLHLVIAALGLILTVVVLAK